MLCNASASSASVLVCVRACQIRDIICAGALSGETLPAEGATGTFPRVTPSWNIRREARAGARGEGARAPPATYRHVAQTVMAICVLIFDFIFFNKCLVYFNILLYGMGPGPGPRLVAGVLWMDGLHMRIASSRSRVLGA